MRATRGDGQWPPGTALARALHVPQSPQGLRSDAGSACAPYASWVPTPTAGCLGSACSTAQESQGQRWVSPCAQKAVDGAEQRPAQSGNCASQLSLLLTADPELTDSQAFYCLRNLLTWLSAKQ